MKLLISILLFITSITLSFGQEDYILTKDQHDKIKKNLDDYKKLIKNFDSLSTEFKYLNERYELTLKLHKKEIFELNNTILNLDLRCNKESDSLKSSQIANSYLQYHNDLLKKEVIKFQKELNASNRQVLIFKSKYYHERKWTTAERIFINAMWAVFITFGTYDLVDLIKNNHHL